ncbi:MAG: hypothetical protein QF546_05895, partial [Alphaproteobacteria bacterium]|nr:hypothetical protein [Alphaproteobacteria bacterium]
MHAATAVGIVPDEHVAGPHVAAIILDELGQGIGERAQVQRHGQTIRDGPALGVAKPRRIIHGIAHDRGIGGAHDDQRHLVGDRAQR